MCQNLYERYAKIRDIRGLTDYKVTKLAGIKGTATISNWKNGKYTPKDDKMYEIADVLNVSFDYLKGKTDKIMCPTCEVYYNPMDENSCVFHEQQHAQYEKALEKYGFCHSSDKCQDEVCGYLNMLSSPAPCYSVDDIANAYIKYLELAFSDFLRDSNYTLKYASFDDYVRECIMEDMHQNFMSHDLFILLSDRYNIESGYIEVNEQLLARVSKNEQYMRILKYIEQLKPETLNALEIQIKALAEQNKTE